MVLRSRNHKLAGMLALIMASPLVVNPGLEGRKGFIVVLKVEPLLRISEKSSQGTTVVIADVQVSDQC